MSSAAEAIASAEAAPSAQPEQVCDLLMKGGITSGVIYPRLIHQLARSYRFKNIGGTSAGAIAASACAAAEYRRRQGSAVGFELLNELPDLLAKPWRAAATQAAALPSQPVPDAPRPSLLLSLFQPHPTLRSHFAVLLSALNLKPRPALAGMLLKMLAQHALLAIGVLLAGALLLVPLLQSLKPTLTLLPGIGIAAGALLLAGLALHWSLRLATGVLSLVLVLAVLCILLLLGLGYGLTVPLRPALAGVGLALLAGTLLTWLVVVGAVVARFALSLLRGLHGNGYGLVSGRSMGTDTDPPGLTDWLTSYLDDVAGLSARAHPLTFGDLWGGADRHSPTAVNLEVMTSAVSQQMIYGIPFREGAPPLYYDPDEFARLFPPRVMDWLAQAATSGSAGTEAEPAGTRVVFAGRTLRRLPRGADLPVIVAVRMSLSFPVLLSAVPLYAVDFSLAANRAAKERARKPAADAQGPEALAATRIWFSDGGIGSNMPLHLFDTLLPAHPTFAINLKGVHPDWPIREPGIAANDGGRIYLPEENQAGSVRHWPAPADAQAFGGLLGFLKSIVYTMQNWRDEIQFPYPGFKDRIVQISQRPSEGGLNLDMPEAAITALAQAGQMAAVRLVDRFHPAGAQQGAGWINHQTVRLRTLLGVLQPASLHLFAPSGVGHWQALAANIRYSEPQQTLAQAFLTGLDQLASPVPSAAAPPAVTASLAGAALKPLAQLRIAPRI